MILLLNESNHIKTINRIRPINIQNLQVFQQYAGILQQKYPDISISGDNFPPGGYRWEKYFHTKIKFPLSGCKLLKLLVFVNFSSFSWFSPHSTLSPSLTWTLPPGRPGCWRTRSTRA